MKQFTVNSVIHEVNCTKVVFMMKIMERSEWGYYMANNRKNILTDIFASNHFKLKEEFGGETN